MARTDGLTVIRTHRGSPESLDGPRYQVTTVTGRTLTLSKEFYAQGPSLFVWTLTGYPHSCHEFSTMKAALAFAAAHPSTPDASTQDPADA